jgi:ribosomal protein S27E
LVLALFLAYLAVPSMTSFIEFMDNGDIEVSYEATMCSITTILVALVTFTVNIPNALLVLKGARLPKAMRAAWFLLLFPVIFFTFVIGTFSGGFFIFATFGWPMHLMGIALYPYSAHLVKEDLEAVKVANSLRIQCHGCSNVFLMHKLDEQIRCPYCGAPNLNPTTHDEDGTPMEEATEVVEVAGS